MTRAAYPVDLDQALTALVDAARAVVAEEQYHDSGTHVCTYHGHYRDRCVVCALAAAVAAFDNEEDDRG